MLKPHETDYINRNTKKPHGLDVGESRYEVWADMWPSKNQVSLSTLRWPETKVGEGGFLESPKEKWGDNQKVSYEWNVPATYVFEPRS